MKTYLLLLTACLFAATAHATPTTLDWPDLIDQSTQDYDDPYLDLSYEQIDDLREVLMLRQQISSDAEGVEGAQASLDAAIARLAETGIDADWLISQRWVVADKRELAATSGNPEVDGKTVQLAGFAIPAPNDEDGTAVVYLVPERGMCSHMPPPNPNQMVRVRLTGDWTPQFMHEPVRLTGQLSIAPSEQTMQVVDGFVPMRATFAMEANDVETAKPVKAIDPDDTTNEWAQKIAERLRVGGHFPQSTAPESQ